MKRVLCFLILAASFAAFAGAATEADGWGTNAELLAAANGGDREAQHSWAIRLWFGRGMERDRPGAMVWWRRAASQGQSSSQYWLGAAYELGIGVETDYVEAARWYRAASDQGLGVAQASLGDLYAKGLGVPHDDAQALSWFRKGAAQSDASSQYALGEMYWNGRGVDGDPVEATKWYGLAADAGFTAAQVALGESYEIGRGRPKDLVCAYFWIGFAAELGWDFAGEKRDALAAKLAADELVEARRMIGRARLPGEGPVERPLCADETISLHLKGAALADVLRIFEQLSGRRIVGAEKATSTVTIDVDDVAWTKALTDVLSRGGWSWARDGEVLRVVALETR